MSENERVPFMPNLNGLSFEERKMLGDFYDSYSKYTWFRGAQLVKNHPTQFRTVLVITCDYRPLTDMGPILTFTDKYGIGLEWINLSNR